MTYAIQQMELTRSVEALLSANGLPVSDLQDGTRVILFGYMAERRLCGVVGLEICGQVALLRSLAVSTNERGSGLGPALVSYAERYAARRGIETIYLLTTTAATFFERHGYSHASRKDAPAAIAGTSQFSGLCPSSSAFMVKPVAC